MLKEIREPGAVFRVGRARVGLTGPRLSLNRPVTWSRGRVRAGRAAPWDIPERAREYVLNGVEFAALRLMDGDRVGETPQRNLVVAPSLLIQNLQAVPCLGRRTPPLAGPAESSCLWP